MDEQLRLLIMRYLSKVSVSPASYLFALFIISKRIQIQTLVERYLVIDMLERGGFGRTYLALDNLMPRPFLCVIKQLNPLNTDPQTVKLSRELFQKEAQVLQQLGNHPQIPQLLAYFEQDEQFYLVQEYIEGTTLNKLLFPGNQLNEAETIQILQDVLEVLTFVHQDNNIIHRDIKPANLIKRESDNKIVLIDFGAVKEITTKIVNPQGEAQQTVIVGTPEYMSSEQNQGNPQYASDIYSLGLIGIQALTGKSPSRLTRDPYQELIWLTDPSLKINPSLATILTKMVRHSLRERYTSASEVLPDLKSINIAQKTANEKTKLMGSPRQNTSTIRSNLGFTLILIMLFLGGGLTIQKFITKPKTPNPLEQQIVLNSYSNAQAGISIKYPIKWTIQEGNNGNKFILYSQDPASQDNLIITIESLNDSALSLDKYTENLVNKTSKKEALGGSVAIWRGRLSQQEARQIVYEQNIDGKMFQVTRTFTLLNNKIYSLISKIDKNNLSKDSKSIREMIESFEIAQPSKNN